MHFLAKPEVATNLIPGMYTLNEEVVARRRRAGDQQWGANVEVAAPLLPPLSGSPSSGPSHP